MTRLRLRTYVTRRDQWFCGPKPAAHLFDFAYDDAATQPPNAGVKW